MMAIDPARSTERMVSAAPTPPAELPIIRYFTFAILVIVVSIFSHALSLRLRQRDKVGKNFKPDFTALLRMKLSGDQIAAGNDTTKGNTVFRLTGKQRFVLRGSVIAVDEVEIGVIRYAGENGMGGLLLYLVPPHMRSFQPRRKLPHRPRENTEA